ncbi:MAG: hypothetical protein KY455_04055 [Euryarchaeota archaeon]|nr:hypothetical protein [Euryarchaeota archaeon]
MKIDLMGDAEQIARRVLTNEGHTIPAATPADDVIRNFLNVTRRTIPPMAYRVHTSQALSARTLSADYLAGLDALRTEAKKGTPLRPRLSRRLMQADYEDMMLNDWGIHHLHLGMTIEADGFVKRTDVIAFAIAQPESGDLYLIDALPHAGAFVRQELLAAIEDDWPHLLDPYVLKGVEVTKGISDEELSSWRKAGTNAVVVTPGGRQIAAMGGGVSTAMTSMADQRALMHIKQVLRQVEKDVLADASRIEQAIGVPSSTMDIRLEAFGDEVLLRENETGIRLRWPGAEGA